MARPARGALAGDFLLDPEVVFLNHGSFGACPRPVWEAYQAWQLETERQPVDFFATRSESLLAAARAELGEFLGCQGEQLAFVTCATVACNMLAHGWPFEPGDEILGNDHEYGACERAWEYHVARRGLSYRRATLRPGPDCAEHLLSQASPRTRAIYLSHLTSPTALVLPVAEIARLARAREILTLVDGAHAPGQLDLRLDELGVDAYFGNLHKWLNTPKGSAFLWVAPEHSPGLLPLVAGWGFEPEAPFASWHERWGTRDLAAFLSVSAALAYHRERLTPVVRQSCHSRVTRFLGAVGSQLYPSAEWHRQMGAARLADGTDVDRLKAELYQRYRIEIPVYRFGDKPWIRLSSQAYNSDEEADYLVEALRSLRALP